MDSNRYSVVEEDHARPYRRALVESLPEPPLGADNQRAVHQLRARLEALTGIDRCRPIALSLLVAGARHRFHSCNRHTRWNLEPLEKQALLEQPTLLLRTHALVELLEMRRLAWHVPDAPGRPH